MFSEQAVLKLKQVAETLLAKPEPGKDANPQNPQEVTETVLTKPERSKVPEAQEEKSEGS